MTEAAPSPAAGPATGTGDVAPARAAGVVLIGEMEGSGYRTPPALARRADGQTVQLTPLLYATLSALDGQRSYAEVAALVAGASGRPVSGSNVRDLVEKLRPLGLVTQADGSAVTATRTNPLLALRFKVAVTDPDTTRRLTAPFAALFSLVVVVPVLAAFAWICWWVLLDKGLASATHDAFARPGLLLTVLAITVLSAGFHEFGHAAAARRGGATPGVMGAGLYLVWPAFYTDVTDSYRLGRVGRLRTDLGGLYFNAIVAVATAGVWWVSRNDAVLLLVATQILQMLRQLLPFVRFDGYHVLADLTGVPDLFQRIGPTLRSLVPWRAAHPGAQALKPWARAVVTGWVLTVVPVLLATAVLMVLTLPRLVGTAWSSAGAQQDQMAAAFTSGDLIGTAARALAMVVVILPVVAAAYVLVRVLRRGTGAVWRRTAGHPARRALAGVIALALMAGLAWAWWPSPDNYRPVQAYERGTLGAFLPASDPSTRLAVGSTGAGSVMWPDDAALPTREHPQLALVLTPTGPAGRTSGQDARGDGAATAPATSAGDRGDRASAGRPWIFPFDEPLAPDEGDSQALAVATADGTASYAVAFALVWADGETPLENTNEAYALASCDHCAAVAVAFQVVLVVGEAHAVAPQNISVAVNYDCTSCLTYSLAVQLFATLDGPLSEQATSSIEQLWQEITAYGASIPQVSLSQIQDQLTAYEQQILAIIEQDQGSTSPSPTSDPSPSATAVSSDEQPTPTATPTSSLSDSATTGSATSSDASTSPGASPTAAAPSDASPTGGSATPDAPAQEPSAATSQGGSPTATASPAGSPSPSP